MPYACIICSDKIDRFYIGATSNGLEKRIENHNNSNYGKQSFTAKAKDWKLYLSFETDSFDHALRIEQKIKAMKSKVFIRNLKKYPELKLKIYDETKIS